MEKSVKTHMEGVRIDALQDRESEIYGMVGPRDGLSQKNCGVTDQTRQRWCEGEDASEVV